MSSEIKPIAGLDRTLLSGIVPISVPFTAYIFPTTFCNFKCLYCAHSLSKEQLLEKYGLTPQHMSLDTLTCILTQLKEFPQELKVISLTGHGEPLLHPQISSMVQMVKAAKVSERVEMITNASLLTHQLADNLIHAGLDTIRISIQGLSSQKYRDVCGYSIDFDNLLDNIRYFFQNAKNCKVFVKIMDIALEPGEEEKFYSLFCNISDRMFVEKCRPVYHGVKMTDCMDSKIDRFGRVHESRTVCPLCFYMLGIFPNGDVEPCDSIYKPVILGNVHHQKIFAMWHGEKLRQFQEMQLKMQRAEHPKCSLCCAPDDVSHPEDVLDGVSLEILQRMKGKTWPN